MPYIGILCFGENLVFVDTEIAKCFTNIFSKVEARRLDDKDGLVMRLSLEADILRLIIEWVTYYKNNLTVDIGSFEAGFLNYDEYTLSRLKRGVFYLGIRKLYEVAKKTFDMIESAHEAPEEVGRILNTKNDSTPEEEDQEMELIEDKLTETNQRKRNRPWTDSPDGLKNNKYRRTENYPCFI